MSEALRDIASELTTALAPLIDAARDADALKALLSDLGWTPNSLPQPLLDIAASGAELVELIAEGESASGERLIAAVKRLVQAIAAIRNLPDAAFPTGLDLAEFKSTLARDLLDYLLVEYLLDRHPAIGAPLKLAGLIRLTNTPASGLRGARVRREIVWNRIGALFTDPLSGFREAFDWSSVAPRLHDALADLSLFLDGSGLQLGYVLPSPAILAFLHDGAPPPADELLGVELVFDEVFGAPEGISVGIHGYVRPPGGTRPAGIALLPFAHLSGTTKVDLTDALALKLDGSVDFEGGIAITFAPGQPPEVKAGLEVGAANDPPGLSVGLQLKPPPDEPERVLLGDKDASRLAVSGVTVSVGVRLVTGTDLDVFFQVDLDKVRVVVKPGPDESDSFLAKVLGEDGLSFESSFGMRLSNRTGMSFTGSGGLEASFPLHVALGPIDLQALTLALKVREGGFDIESGVNVSGKLGPLAFAVERAGFKLLARFPDEPNGNLGPIDLGFGFMPPAGVGLSVDAGPVKGGGYLFFDFDREEYAGALELVFSDWIALRAIGLITTRMPDGSKGFSMLIIITVEFGTGLQLGYGFTLIGVGGLLGIHRTVKIEPLTQGVRTGAIESVVFPHDIIANAPRIISDLRAFFPPQQDMFLLGPMAKIGWGTPTLLSVSLGIILEIPSINITILGVIKLVLPTEEADVLRLQVNFVGRIEPSNKLLWFYAQLYDSRVLFITLEGGMGLLVSWGDQPNFVLSVGGFHPRYSPPPLPFPVPPRLALSILNESYARIRVDAYFAVTSNSVQFGAHADLFFGLSEFCIEGHLGFDALFRFDPFFFSFNISVSLGVKVFGIGLFSVGFSGLLEGPTPWHIEGKGSISLLFFDISVPFSHTWGENQDTSLEPVPVFPLLEAEVEALTNWQAELPAGNNIAVSLRKLGDDATDQLVLHPLGRLRLSQRKIPLNLTIDKVGTQRPSDANKFSLGATLQGGGPLAVSDVSEPFATGQFIDLSDAERLSRPGFEPQDSGVQIAVTGAQRKTSQAVRRTMRYESIIIDNNFKRFIKPFGPLSGLLSSFLFEHLLKGAAVSKAAVSQQHKKRLTPFEERIEIRPAGYAVAFNDNNAAVGGESTFTSHARAMQYMNEQIQRDPALATRLHVIPTTELSEAA